MAAAQICEMKVTLVPLHIGSWNVDQKEFLASYEAPLTGLSWPWRSVVSVSLNVLILALSVLVPTRDWMFWPSYYNFCVIFLSSGLKLFMLTEFFCGFPQFLQADSSVVAEIWLQLLHFISFLIHHYCVTKINITVSYNMKFILKQTYS